jgi:hypothetical protein
MAIDAYSLCPGGTGKKIKFCCSADFFSELEKIDRMLEGEQYTACLKHIERLRELPANVDRQCLLAYQIMLLRATGQLETAQELAAYFLKKYPTNQAASAELSMLAASKNDNTTAMYFLQHSLASAKGAWAMQTYHAAATLAEQCFEQRQWQPARALLQFLLSVDRSNRNATRMLTELMRSAAVPLLLKEDPRFPLPPDNAPWAKRFSQALGTMSYGDWRTTEANLAALASEVSDSPDIWRTLAVIRGWLGDFPGSIEALQKYASLNVPLEDAVEAEAMAMLVSESPLGDAMPVLTVTWTVKDVEPLQEALLSDPRIKSIPFDPASLSGENSPPPKAVFLLFDRPEAESTEGISAQFLPRFLGQFFLFGRQTDRDARLELVGVTAGELPHIKTMLIELAGKWLEGAEKTEQLGALSATADLLQPQLRPPMQFKQSDFNKILSEYRSDVVLHRWPDMKLGVLDGRSPREAAADAKYKIKLSAAVLVLQYYADNIHFQFDMNELRSQLGLPILDPIEPQPGKISQVPLVRLARLDVEKLSDEDLSQAFQRAVGYNHRVAALKFGKAIIDRASFASRKELSLAYITLARMEEDLDQAMSYIESGRRAAGETSHAMWDLEELSLRFARQEAAEALQLIRHIESTHINEPNVSLILTQILVEAGLLRPDGTPAIPTSHAEDAMSAAEVPESESGKLWTPGGEATGGGGKLWVPE